MAPISTPVVVPDTLAICLVRVPAMVIVGPGTDDGVTAFDGSDATVQPAPVNAFTVNVYVVPFASPPTVHDRPDVRQIRPPGDAIAWYAEIEYEPEDAGADHDTDADRSSATAVTPRGGSAGVGGGGGGGTA